MNERINGLVLKGTAQMEVDGVFLRPPHHNLTAQSQPSVAWPDTGSLFQASVCHTGEVGVISNPNSRGYCETKHPASGSSYGDNVSLPCIWMFRCECPRALDVMPSVGNTALNETDLDPALLKLRE